jgi:UDP-N-acetylmuramate dehydrogenase
LDKDKIYSDLIKIISPQKISIDEPMKEHTTFKIGGNADVFLKLDSVEDIKNVLKYAKENSILLTIIGNGSNVLVKDNGIRGITLKLDLKEIQVHEEVEFISVYVGAGIMLPKFSIEMANNGYSGLEFAAGIPGTIGGAVRMNAGAYGGEMSSIIDSVICIDRDGNLHEVKKEDAEFRYRKSIFSKNNWIILQIKLKLKYGNKDEINKKIKYNMDERKQKQPINMPSAGSTFKRKENLIPAKVIEECGLKGKRLRRCNGIRCSLWVYSKFGRSNSKRCIRLSRANKSIGI